MYVDEFEVAEGAFQSVLLMSRSFADVACVSMGTGLFEADCDVLDVRDILGFLYEVCQSRDRGVGDRGGRPVHA